ncbi:hypothetical protein [Psychromonas sp. SP041]|uniref:hypothetical protein n=1 Tax=Psychromonas sp. SP041 TaxID=1365007 RepID=UPI0010C7ACF7|nr:hypothetical protein [Psychromonas sp. SP041]
MALIIIPDQYVESLFHGSDFGALINNRTTEKRSHLYKTITSLSKGNWSGHSSYSIALNGGFIADGDIGSPKQLTLLGTAFIEAYETKIEAGQA